MKKILFLSIGLLSVNLSKAQDQNIGLLTSPRGGIIAADVNPAELSNMRYKYEIGIFGASGNFSNNRVKLNSTSSQSDTQAFKSFFLGDETVDLRINANISLPSFAIKVKKWAFGLSSQFNGGASAFNVNSDLGRAIIRDNEQGKSSSITTLGKQRINAAAWSEINLSTSRVLFENQAHRINAGLTLKFLMPAMYANVSIDKLSGQFKYTQQADSQTKTEKMELSGVSNTNLSIAYSDASGGFNGFGTDIGLSYQLKDTVGFYKMNLGMSVKNIGSLTYKSKAGEETFSSYVLNTDVGPSNSLDIKTIDGDIQDVEKDLEKRGYIKTTQKTSSQKVKLPTVFVLYTDIRIVPKFHVSLYTQQRIGDLEDNYQIPAQNVFAITPRFTIKYFDVYSTWANYEVSGISGGLGFRVGGFYVGSNSIITALAGGKSIDATVGARWAFGE